MKKNVSLKGKLDVEVFKEDACFVASIPALQVSSYGDSEQEAVANVKDALTLFIDSCLERDVLREALVECGWQVSAKSISPPRKRHIPLALEPLNEHIRQYQLQGA